MSEFNENPESGRVEDEMAAEEDFSAPLDEDLESSDIDDEEWRVTTKNDDELDAAYLKRNLNIVVQKNDYMLYSLNKMIHEDRILNPKPYYQRRLKWSKQKKSLLIESILLNVPIPPIFVLETELARFEVLDGQQRISTIAEFMNNEFSLSGLKIWEGLNGRTYDKCPPSIRRGLDRRSISAVQLMAEGDTPDLRNFLRRIIFNRLNTGGVALNAQELRNSLYSGPFNDLIVQLSRKQYFTTAFDIPPHFGEISKEGHVTPARSKNTYYRKMEDVQIVLRFFALRKINDIRGSLTKILDNQMQEGNKLSDVEIREMGQEFEERFEFCMKLFDNRPFRIRAPNSERKRISKPLYDAVMVALGCVYLTKVNGRITCASDRPALTS